jgi:hypothetical protein
MSAPHAAPRRRITLVRAVKQSLLRATSNTETNSTDGLSRHNMSSYPSSSSVHSAPLLPRNASTRSTSSFGEFTRHSSVASLGAEEGTSPPLAVQRDVQQSCRGPRPEALPTPHFYERFPRAVGPLANVLITSPEEYQMFCLTARPIEVVDQKEDRNVAKDRLCAEDIAKGGFFVYQPNSDAPRYFLLHDKKVDVYGTSAYIRR